MSYTLTYHFYRLRAADYVREYRDVEKFEAFCKECDRYDNCWVCPPYERDLAAGLQTYEFVSLIGTQIVPLLEGKQNAASGQKKQITVWQLLKEVRAKLDPCLRNLEIVYPGSRAFFMPVLVIYVRKANAGKFGDYPAVIRSGYVLLSKLWDLI